MKLSLVEEKRFQKIYNRLKRKTINNLTRCFCLKLMVFRATIPEPVAKKVIHLIFFIFLILFKVWSIVTKDFDQDKALDQTKFYILLKYIAGLQNGLSLNEINPEEIGLYQFYTVNLFFFL